MGTTSYGFAGHGKGTGIRHCLSDTGDTLPEAGIRWEEGWGDGEDTYPGHSTVSFIGCGRRILCSIFGRVRSDAGSGQPDDLKGGKYDIWRQNGVR